MPARSRSLALRFASAPACAGTLAFGSMSLAMLGLGPRLLAEARFGAICSGHAAALHCPACYAAAALIALAVATLASAPRTRPARRRG